MSYQIIVSTIKPWSTSALVSSVPLYIKSHTKGKVWRIWLGDKKDKSYDMHFLRLWYIAANVREEIRDQTDHWDFNIQYIMSTYYLRWLIGVFQPSCMNTWLPYFRNFCFPYICSNIPKCPAYGVDFSQRIIYTSPSCLNGNVLEKGRPLNNKLFGQGYTFDK